MDPELAIDEFVVALGCFLMLYLGMLVVTVVACRRILRGIWVASSHVRKWTIQHGSKEMFYSLLWRPRAVLPRRYKASWTGGLDRTSSSQSSRSTSPQWTTEEIQDLWDEFYNGMCEEELENLENYLES